MILPVNSTKVTSRNALSSLTHRLLLLMLFLILLLNSVNNLALAQQKINIGVLAYSPAERVIKRWQPLAEELSRKIPNTHVQIQALNYQQLKTAIQEQTIDFVFTNPASYIQYSHTGHLTAPLVTLVGLSQGQEIEKFGGVIVLPANSPIRTLSELRGITVAIPSKESFGGYLSQAYLLQKHAISTQDFNLLTTKMPHSNAIHALISHKANAAFVRTGVIESMIQAGELTTDEFKILSDKGLSKYPFLLSTDAYPEWPFIALKNTPEEIAAKVTTVLLSIPHKSPLTNSLQIHGFTVPADYQPIRDVLQALRVSPYNGSPQLTLNDVWEQYGTETIIILVLLIASLLLLAQLFKSNCCLNAANQSLERMGDDLRITAACFHSQQPILITDSKKRIIRINPAFTDVTGYSEADVIGKSPVLLASGKHSADFYKSLWKQLNKEGFWKGEMWNRKKSGEVYPILQTITAIKNEQGVLTNYQAIFYDITESKADVQHYKDLALQDPLTQLANRRVLNDHLAHAIAIVKRNHHYSALIFIDLDNFKPLNDTHGHHIGDILLTEVANRLKQSTRDIDTVARLGGDEFVILLEELGESYQDAHQLANQICQKMHTILGGSYDLDGLSYALSASVGVTIFSDEILSPEEALKQADIAMYQSKSNGKNSIFFFDHSQGSDHQIISQQKILI